MVRRFLFPLALLVAACHGPAPDTPPGAFDSPDETAGIDPLPVVTVRFDSAHWNGKTVPAEGRCKALGGTGRTPPLIIGGIPTGARTVLVAFSKRGDSDLDDGGLGVVGWTLPLGASLFVTPPVPGQTESLPPGAWIERSHGAALGPRVGYLGPCFPESGAVYEADVRVMGPTGQGEQGVMAHGVISLGQD
ncbi:hypothetical protein [Pararhodospirillum oryzae]|uniref:Lipoprotein n=1 Tax=Pararhodospirillum oryzae TaxID=478448 RepID=A0A512H3P8_9PROT|nr:hypothetical protein [Pararhodospirillum oryzae]GEO80067.1 hypothetical protein ROR02_01980 [Pararhodospirillum oryzae]